MLLIPCPYCGERDEHEFRFGGEDRDVRPELGVSDVEWSDYLFNRSNSKGVQTELWCHGFGCGQWFKMVRNTMNHEIIAVSKMNEIAGNLQCEIKE